MVQAYAPQVPYQAQQPERAWTTGSISEFKVRPNLGPQLDLDQIIADSKNVILGTVNNIQAQAAQAESTSGASWQNNIDEVFANAEASMKEGLAQCRENAKATIQSYPPDQRDAASGYFVQGMGVVNTAIKWVINAISQIWQWIRQKVEDVWKSIKAKAGDLIKLITSLFM